MTHLIACSTVGQIRLITLERPERRNALTPEMLDELLDTVRAPTAASALVLAGTGTTFCSGFDLSLCEGDSTGHTMRRLLATLSGVVRALRTQPLPVVIAAHGGAIAGGCALLGGGDVVVSDRAAVFGYPVVRLGVSPGVSAPTLSRLVGQGATRPLQLDPGLVRGPDALRLGLVHVLVEQAVEVLPRAIELATSLAEKPRDAMAATRRWLDDIEGSLAGHMQFNADLALATSLSLVTSPEERALLRAPAPRATSRANPS